MTLLLDNTIKISAVLAVVLCAVRLMRHRSAAVRHWVLAAGILCATVTPAVAVVVPWTFGLDNLVTDNKADAPVVTTEIGPTAAPVAIAARPQPVRRPTSRAARVDPRLLVLGLWLCGAAAIAGVTIVGFLRLVWLSSRARPLTSGSWPAAAEEIAAARGLKRRVALLQSGQATLLVTWGFLHPRILLPSGAAAWSEERVRIVLEHEIAHIQRGDWLVFMAAELLRASHWFNPLVWIACARMRQESERACDDAVLVAGVRSHDYATHLLELARLLNARRAMSPWAAPAMARASSLQGRISVMLNANVDRTPLTSSFRIASTVVVLALTVFIAGLRAQTFVTLSGSVADPANRALADAQLVLSTPDGRSKHEVRSDASGRYAFAGITPGEYTLDVLSPGFAELNEPITIGSRDVDRNISLKVGSLRETIMVTGVGGGTSGEMRTTLTPEARKRVEAKQLATIAACTANPSVAGGNIVQPLKLTSVQPQYPGGDGVVILDATIGTDGNVRDITVMSPPNASLDEAAAAAVREWQFTPTLLDCMPTDVHMKVTITFRQK